MQSKLCRRCGIYKLTSEFWERKDLRGGLVPVCKECHSTASHLERQRENKRKRILAGSKEERQRVCSRYGITVDDYERLLKDQNGTCAICGNEETRIGTKSLHIDHDHATGHVRGLLCSRCNSLLGFAREKPSILRKAIDYLVRAFSAQLVKRRERQVKVAP